MPKKEYEYDYEWDGNATKQPGVNIQAKHPFSAPAWKSPISKTNTKCTSHTPVQEAATPKRAELQSKHPWEKPNWATVDQSPKKETTHSPIVKSSIPKPMLRDTPNSPLKNNTNGTTTAGATPSGDKEADDAVEALERQLAEAKRRREELLQQEEERQKHTVEETKLELARRLAKEREEQRWRDTLQQRNERDKQKRLLAAKATTSSSVMEDTAWQKPKPVDDDTTQTRIYENDPYGTNYSHTIDQQQMEGNALGQDRHEESSHDTTNNDYHYTDRQLDKSNNNGQYKDAEKEEDYPTQFDDEANNYEWQQEEEEEEEEVTEEEEDPVALRAAELQRQIDALQRELQQV